MKKMENKRTRLFRKSLLATAIALASAPVAMAAVISAPAVYDDGIPKTGDAINITGATGTAIAVTDNTELTVTGDTTISTDGNGIEVKDGGVVTLQGTNFAFDAQGMNKHAIDVGSGGAIGVGGAPVARLSPMRLPSSSMTVSSFR